MIFNSEKGHSITTKNIKNRREIILMDRDDCSEFETPQKSARLQEKEYKLAEKEAAKETPNKSPRLLEKEQKNAKEKAEKAEKKRKAEKSQVKKRLMN